MKEKEIRKSFMLKNGLGNVHAQNGQRMIILFCLE